MIGCGVVLMAGIIVAVIAGTWLLTGPEGGVRLKNEMEEYATKYLEEHQVLGASEDLIAYYDVTVKLDGTEAAILTTKRIIYHKDNRNNSIDLKDIKDVKYRKETLVGDILEIYSRTGDVIKIEIAPFNQGETFRNALMNAWQEVKKVTLE